MSKLGSQALLALSLIALPLASHADLVDRGLNTLDTASGLEWLDLSQTQGLSFNQVAAQFGAGGAYAGYRYASTTEMQKLLGQLGMPIVANTNYAANTWQASIARFDALLGLNVGGLGPAYGFEALTGDTTQGYHQLFYGTANAMHTAMNADPADAFAAGDRLVSASAEATVGYSASFAERTLSSFLVRDAAIAPVPEPGTYALMLVGLVALGAAARRRQQG